MTTTIARHASKKTSKPININSKLCLFANHIDSDFDQTINYGVLYAEENSVIDGIGHFEYSVRVSKQENLLLSRTEKTVDTEKIVCVSNQMCRPDSAKIYEGKSEGLVEDTYLNNPNSSQFANIAKDKFGEFKRTEQSTALMEFTKSIIECQNTDPEFSVPDEDSDEKCDDERIEKAINVTPSQSPVEPYEKDEASKMMRFCSGDRDSQTTPLISSRSSSLGSLTGYEQQSAHEYESITTDVSHQTSELVFHSESTDSTVFLIPPNTSCERDRQFVKKKCLQKLPSFESHIQQKELAKDGIFADELAVFKEESTPIEFRSFAASSLSSLTIDDAEDGFKYRTLDLSDGVSKFAEIGSNLMANQFDSEDQAQGVHDLNAVTKKENYLYADEEKILDEYVRKGIAKVTKHRVNESSSSDPKSDDEYHFEVSNLKPSSENACSSNSVTCLLDENSDLTAEEEELLDECIRRGIAKVTHQNIKDITPVSLRKGSSKVSNINKCEAGKSEIDDRSTIERS